MKLAHKLARAVGGLFVAGAVASGANAAIDLPSSDVNNTGGSELILAVWDPTSQSTHVLDTGIAFNDVTSLTSGVIAQLDITGIDMANARWVALAADSQDSTAAPTAAEAGRRLITTSDSNTIDLVPTDRPNMGSALDNLTGFIARHNQQAQIDGLVGDDVQSNVAGLVEGSLGA
ncbi:MAG TPA: hypothetical protein DCZ13_00225, partial [Porticoccaceae bacterium]|nr:hypothetical protein [Porticoccaceae bacterium]